MKFQHNRILGIAALVFCVLAGLFLVPGLGHKAAATLASAAFLVGLTVTYAYPVSGTTPPTTIQAARKNMLTATVVCADGDTQITLTHNWDLSATENTNKFPVVTWNYVTPGTAPLVLSGFSRTPTTVVLTKASGAGTGATFEVNLERPHSIIR